MCAMHARKTARDAYFPTRFDDAVLHAARRCRIPGHRGRATLRRPHQRPRRAHRPIDCLRPAELAAMALVHEIFHAVIGLYREKNPSGFDKLRGQLGERLGSRRRPRDARSRSFARSRHLQSTSISRARATRRPRSSSRARVAAAEDEYTEEVMLLWLTNQNPAYEPVRSIVTDADLGDTYTAFVGETQRFFEEDAPLRSRAARRSLDLLLAPRRAAPGSILDQLKYIEENWGQLARARSARRSGVACSGRRTSSHEEGKYFYRGGPGPGAPLLERDALRAPREGRGAEALQRRPRLDAARGAHREDASSCGSISSRRSTGATSSASIRSPTRSSISSRSRGFTGLWLIGLCERSTASQKIKQMRGDPGRRRLGVLADEVRHRAGARRRRRRTRT